MMFLARCHNCQRSMSPQDSFLVALQVNNHQGGHYAFKDLCLCRSCKDLVVKKYKEEIQEEYGGE